MSLKLPSSISLPTDPGHHNTALASLVLWSLIFVSSFAIRILQEHRYWKHRQNKRLFRVLLYAWFRNLICLLGQIRIVGFALYIAVKKPSRALVITEVVLQGVGVSPLTLELALVLIRVGRYGLTSRSSTHFPHRIHVLLAWTRAPIVIAIVLICVAGFIVNTTLLKAGCIAVLAAFAYLVSIMLFLIFGGSWTKLPQQARVAIWVLVAALPFYVVRLVYVTLGDFAGGWRYSPTIGDWEMAVAMELVMEVVIVVLLVGSSLVVEPIVGKPARAKQEEADVAAAEGNSDGKEKSDCGGNVVSV